MANLIHEPKRKPIPKQPQSYVRCAQNSLPAEAFIPTTQSAKLTQSLSYDRYYSMIFHKKSKNLTSFEMPTSFAAICRLFFIVMWLKKSSKISVDHSNGILCKIRRRY